MTDDYIAYDTHINLKRLLTYIQDVKERHNVDDGDIIICIDGNAINIEVRKIATRIK